MLTTEKRERERERERESMHAFILDTSKRERERGDAVNRRSAWIWVGYRIQSYPERFWNNGLP